MGMREDIRANMPDTVMFASTLRVSPNQEMHMSKTMAVGTTVVEWAPFRLKPGVDDETLIERSERLQQEFLSRQQGFVRRELLKGDDGGWVDLVYWADQASADAIMSALGNSDAASAYFAVMIGADPADPSGGVSHFQQVRAYP
jgi:hypothetical protein